MAQGHSVQHGFVGIPAKDGNGQIHKGQVQTLDGKSPNIGLVGRVLFGPNIQDIIRHCRIKEGHHWNAHHCAEWIREYTANRSQEPAKGIIRRPASGARIERNPLFVLLTETALHVHQKEETETEGTRVTKARQEPVYLEIGFDHVPGPHCVVRTDDFEIHAQRQNERGSEPPFRDDRKLVEHVLCTVDI